VRPGAYDAVALGGTIATRTRFRVRNLTPPFRLPPRSLLLVTHRSDWDVPLTMNIYWPGRMWTRDQRLVFVARDDMFLRGFVGGYPPALPLPARRALARVNVGRGLLGHRLALPITNPSRALLADVALDDPALPLASLPEEAVDPLRRRAARLGRAQPRTLADVHDGAYLDLLWRPYDRADLPGLHDFWGRRQARARRDLEALIAHVQDGGSLVLYPEGRPSPDGAVGPLQRGLAVLIRRASPDVLVPGGLAYDPLGRGRTRAYLTLGEPFAPPRRGVEGTVLRALRRTLPLTPGQLAAHAALHNLDASRVDLDDRPREPRLRELLPDAVAAARTAPRPLLERLDREFTSARS
jgi:1-acyl-sn-glycerol-3-phosphate acyltransferase